MKRLSYFIFAFSFLLFLISLFGFFLSKPIMTKTFYTSANVSDNIGFDLNSNALTFGHIKKPGSSTRNIVLDNHYSFPIVAVIKAEGDIEPLLHFDNIVSVEEGESKKISFSVIASEDMEEGFYSGNVRFELFKL